MVLGGTLLTGGVGMVAGTLFGGMILGLIATLIIFNGSLNGAWIMISGGVLLFLFIVLQRFLVGSFSLRRTRVGMPETSVVPPSDRSPRRDARPARTTLRRVSGDLPVRLRR